MDRSGGQPAAVRQEEVRSDRRRSGDARTAVAPRYQDVTNDPLCDWGGIRLCRIESDLHGLS